MDIRAFDEKVRAYAAEHPVSGQVRLTVCDEVLYDGFFGCADADTGRPFAGGDRFTLYSLTKPFVAMGLLRLADEGRVDLDAHPSRYVPEAEGFDGRVTVRLLLHHESGLPDFLQTEGFTRRPAPLREQIRELSACPSFFAPGEGSRYSNINFTLCALIIESVSGLHYAEYMKRFVFEPLGMKTVSVDDGKTPVPRLVSGSRAVDGKLVSVSRCTEYLFGAGDLTGTAEDVYALNRAVKHRLILKPDTWDMALTPAPVSGFGMGCYVGFLHGHPRVMHTGGHTGFRNLHLHLTEEDIDLILLLNCENAAAREDITEILAETVL